MTKSDISFDTTILNLSVFFSSDFPIISSSPPLPPLFLLFSSSSSSSSSHFLLLLLITPLFLLFFPCPVKSNALLWPFQFRTWQRCETWELKLVLLLSRFIRFLSLVYTWIIHFSHPQRGLSFGWLSESSDGFIFSPSTQLDSHLWTTFSTSNFSSFSSFAVWKSFKGWPEAYLRQRSVFPEPGNPAGKRPAPTRPPPSLASQRCDLCGQ